MANQGSVAEPHALVHITLAEATSGPSTTRTWSGLVPLGGSVALPTSVFAVKPGTSYVLTVSAASPAGGTGSAASTYQATLPRRSRHLSARPAPRVDRRHESS